MNRNKRKLILSLLLSVALGLLGACKEWDELMEEIEKETPEQDNTLSSPMAPANDASAPTDHMNLRSTGPLNLNAIKINNAAVNINLPNSFEPWRAMNNSVFLAESGKINKIEIQLSNQGEMEAYLGYSEIRLQSLVDYQAIIIIIYGITLNNNNIETSPETFISLYYEDMLHGGFYHAMEGDLSMVDFVTFNGASIVVNLDNVMTNLASKNTGDQIMVGEHSRPELDVNGKIAGLDDIEPKFYTNDLFAVNYYTDGEINYQGQPLQRIANCVFASVDSPPTDIADICQAYLSIH